MARAQDVFPNITGSTITMSAANTLTFLELLTGVNLGSGTGLLVDKLEWFPAAASLLDMDTDGDSMTLALCTNNTITVLGIADRRVVFLQQIARMDFGVAAAAQMLVLPLERLFNPPIILATPRLFIAMTSVGMTVAGIASVRFYFRYVELTDKEYLELAEAFVLLG